MPSLTLLAHEELKSGRQIHCARHNMKKLQEARKKLSKQDKIIKRILKENIKIKAKIKELKKCLVKNKNSEKINVGLKINNEIIKKLMEHVKGKYNLTKIVNHTHKTQSLYQNNLKEKLERIKVQIRKIVRDVVVKDRRIKLLESKLRINN